MSIMYSKLNQMDCQSCIVAIGSNQRLNNSSLSDLLIDGVSRIAKEVGTIKAVSRFFETPAFPAGSGPNFVNAVLCVDAARPADEILTQLHVIEHELGRVRKKRWGQRTIDIDLIAVDNEIAPNPETYKKWQLLPIAQQTEIAPDRLILPHPRMQDRAFVLGPLMDIWPDWIHPVIHQSARQMFADLDVSDQSALSPL